MKQLSDLNENSTVQDFLDYFESIPDDKWCVDYFRATDFDPNANPEACCALGHVGCTRRWNDGGGKLGERLERIAPEIVPQNNGYYVDSGGLSYHDPDHPRRKNIKQRVVAYLRGLLPVETPKGWDQIEGDGAPVS